MGLVLELVFIIRSSERRRGFEPAALGCILAGGIFSQSAYCGVASPARECSQSSAKAKIDLISSGYAFFS